MKKTGQDDEYWGNNSVGNYVQLKPGAAEAVVDRKIRDITKRHSDGKEQQELFLHPIGKWQLYSDFENGKIVGRRIEIVRLFCNSRKVLVVAQFSFAIILIICTFIVVQQIRYAQQRQPGYERSQLVYHWTTGDINKHFAAIRQALLSSGIASSVTRTSSSLTEHGSDSWDFQRQGKAPGEKLDFNVLQEEDGLVKTAGFPSAS